MLSGGDEVFAIGGDIEGTGDSFGGGVLDGGEGSVGFDGEAGNGVVAAVGDVDEFLGRMDFDI